MTVIVGMYSNPSEVAAIVASHPLWIVDNTGSDTSGGWTRRGFWNETARLGLRAQFVAGQWSSACWAFEELDGTTAHFPSSANAWGPPVANYLTGASDASAPGVDVHRPPDSGKVIVGDDYLNVGSWWIFRTIDRPPALPDAVIFLAVGWGNSAPYGTRSTRGGYIARTAGNSVDGNSTPPTDYSWTRFPHDPSGATLFRPAIRAYPASNSWLLGYMPDGILGDARLGAARAVGIVHEGYVWESDGRGLLARTDTLA